MDDIMKIIKSLEETGLLIKDVRKTIKHEVKEKKGGFLEMLLGALGASLLGYLLIDKGVMQAGKGIIKTGEGAVRAGHDF